MKILYIGLISMLLITACDNDLDQRPVVDIESSSLTNFTGVLNAAYYYHTGAVTPQAVMGEFRADNLTFVFDGEPPYPDFQTFNSDLGGLAASEIFFRPFYRDLYKSILSANNVIDNSSDATQVAEARFLRALSYFKLVMVFGDVTVNLSPSPDAADLSILTRQPAADVYNNVIIPDLQAAIAGLTNSGRAAGRASQIAARGFLGKVYMYRGDFGNAATEFAAVISGATAAGVTLEPNFANVVKDASKEIIFATKMSGSIPNSSTGTAFAGWFQGKDTKADQDNVTLSLIAAFDASGAAGGGTDLRKALTINTALKRGVKYTADQYDQDFIEMRLSDVILMYAEALNESTNTSGAQSATILAGLNAIRTRAGLTSLVGTATTQAAVRTAIAKERRVELALEGHRWFDLVRTGTVDAEMGLTVNPNYYVFPIPGSEILATNGVITQNAGY